MGVMALLDPTTWTDRTANSAAAFQVDSSAAAKPGMLWGGSASNIAVASLVGRMLFNDHKVAVKMETPGADDVFWALLRSNNAHQVGLLAFQGGALCITTSTGTFAALGSTYTVQAQTLFNVTWVDGDVFTIEARGNTYTVYRNGAYQLRWTDDTGIYAANVPDHMQVAMAYVWRSFTTGGFDSFTADDLFIWPSLNGSDGDGVLSALVTGMMNRPVALSGDGVLSALVAMLQVRGAALSGGGALTSLANQLFPRTAPLAGDGALSATAVRLPHPPTSTQYFTNGSVVWPDWANNCDAIGLGGGGGGGSGGFGTTGGGGGVANFATVTWTRAQWLAGGSGAISWTIGTGGSRGTGFGGAGGGGLGTPISLAGVGTSTATGGAAGGGGTNSPQGGFGGSIVYNGQTYSRGGQVGGTGSTGSQPGGGGNGGGANGGTGGFGGAGGIWLYFYE